MILEIEDVCIKYYVISESTVHCLSGWLKNGSVEQASCVPGDVDVKSDPFIAVSFVTLYIDLMRNQPFSTLPVAIFRQCCINNKNIRNTNNHMCLSCVRDDMLNF